MWPSPHGQALRGDDVTFAEHHESWVGELVSQEGALEGDMPAVAGWLQRMCRAAARDLPAMGVGVSLLNQGSNPLTVAASSKASELLEELQFAMGEGPCIDAYASRRPILVADLSATATTTWPGYAPAAHDHGVRAVFAFPLQIGAARLGALDVYRDHPGNMSAETLSRALMFAEVSMLRILDVGGEPEEAAELIDDPGGTHYGVYQAQGMVMIQLGVSAQEALSRLRAYAYAHDRRLNDVARDVIARRLEMESDT